MPTAAVLGCEVVAAKVVVATEALRGALQAGPPDHRQAGRATVDPFVNAMTSGTAAQADAFLRFVRNDPYLPAALRKRNRATFAHPQRLAVRGEPL